VNSGAGRGATHRTGVALAVVAAFGFSFKAILIKLAYPYGVDAVTLLVLRMAFALPAFLWVGFAASKDAPALSRRDWFMVLLLGALGYYGASILDFIGLKYISAGLERLILFTYPTLTLLFGMALHGRAILRREGVALVLCYTGIAAAFMHDLEFAGDVAAVWIGGGFVFASSVCYALYLSGSAGMIAKLGSSRFAALAMLVSTAATGGHFLAVQPLAALVQPWQVYALGAAMGLFSTVVPVFALTAAIRRIGSGQTALVGMVGPLLTIVFAWLLLDEGFSTAQMIGVALVVAGVATVSRR
jgi:drug/metabolite transporter (DMT)-like permease